MEDDSKETTTVTRTFSDESLGLITSFVGGMEGDLHEALAGKFASAVFDPNREWTPDGFKPLSIELTLRELGIIARVLDAAESEFVNPWESKDTGQFAILKASFNRVRAELRG